MSVSVVGYLLHRRDIQSFVTYVFTRRRLCHHNLHHKWTFTVNDVQAVDL